jgi:hypothetical protein
MSGAHPWLKFYPRDWRGDQACGPFRSQRAACGSKCCASCMKRSPTAILILGGRAVSNDVLARVAGLGADECGALLAELESAGVLSRTPAAPSTHGDV